MGMKTEEGHRATGRRQQLITGKERQIKSVRETVSKNRDRQECNGLSVCGNGRENRQPDGKVGS